MYSFEPNEEQQMLVGAVGKYAQNDLRPAAHQAEESRQLGGLRHVEDGWNLFIHGWRKGIADVFHIDIPTTGTVLEELSRIAAATRQ